MELEIRHWPLDIPSDLGPISAGPGDHPGFIAATGFRSKSSSAGVSPGVLWLDRFRAWATLRENLLADHAPDNAPVAVALPPVLVSDPDAVMDNKPATTVL